MEAEVVEKMTALGITSLAQFYTSEMKYFEPEFERDSAELMKLLEAKGFMP